MTQERPRVRMESKQYFDRNIWDMSIDITYFVLDILQVGISRSTYYISFERMCLTDNGSYNKHQVSNNRTTALERTTALATGGGT